MSFVMKKGLSTMKKLEIIILTVVCLLVVGCSREDTQESSILKANVTEVNEYILVVEPVEGSREGTSPIHVSLACFADEESLNYLENAAVGDIVEIEYNGMLEETYPLQMNGAYTIKLAS